MAHNGSLERESAGNVQVFQRESVAEVYLPNGEASRTNGFGSPRDYQRLSSTQPIKECSSVFLYFAVFIVNLISFTSGVGMSWTSPVIPKLNSKETPLNAPLDTLQISWILSLLSIGEIVGPFFYGYLADRIGRKKTLVGVALPMVTGLVMTSFATDVRVYYLARFLHGCGIGGMFSVIPNFVAEISQPHNRGRLGMCCSLLLSLGVLSSYIIGPFLSIKLFSLVCVIPALAFLVVFPLFVPESPVYLAKHGRDKEAIDSLRKFRKGTEFEIQNEFGNIKDFACDNGGQKIGILYLLKTCKKPFIIGVALSVCCQLSGIGVVVGNLQLIFETAGNKIPAKYASIIVGLVKFLTMFVTAALIEKAGRKLLLLVSCAGLSAATILIGTYFYMQNIFPKYTETLWWLPLTCLISYFIFFNLGIGSVSLALQSEIFPTNVRSLAGAFNTTLSFAFAFLNTFLFPIVNKFLGLAAPFWMYGFFTGINCFFIYYYIPETKGKSLAEIQELLK